MMDKTRLEAPPSMAGLDAQTRTALRAQYSEAAVVILRPQGGWRFAARPAIDGGANAAGLVLRALLTPFP